MSEPQTDALATPWGRRQFTLSEAAGAHLSLLVKVVKYYQYLGHAPRGAKQTRDARRSLLPTMLLMPAPHG